MCVMYGCCVWLRILLRTCIITHTWAQKRFLLLVRRLYYMNWNSVNAFSLRTCICTVHTHYLHCQPQTHMYWTQHILSIHMRDSSFLSRSKTTEHTLTHRHRKRQRKKIKGKRIEQKAIRRRRYIRVAVAADILYGRAQELHELLLPGEQILFFDFIWFDSVLLAIVDRIGHTRWRSP